MHDLYQFLSNSGLFNLGQLKGDLLVASAQKLGIEQFLSQGVDQIAENPQLGRMIDALYQNWAARTGGGAEIKEEIQGEEDLRGLPTDLPLKLAILGRAFAGKKTIATQL